MTELTEERIAQADEESVGKAYPVYVKNLKAMGVDNYEVAVSGHNRKFTSATGQELSVQGQLPKYICDKKLDTEALRISLKRMQLGLIDYPTFLGQIATAGVHTYIADLGGMNVTYKGRNAGDEYVEDIPSR